MFSAGVYMLNKPDLTKFSEIIIDVEYEGNGGLIKNHLNNFYTDYSDYSVSSVPDIKFGRVHDFGSGDPECHELANKVRAGKLQAHFQPSLSYLKNLMLPNRS